MPTLKFAAVAAALTDDPRQAPTLARRAGFAGLQFDAFSSALRLPDLSGSGRREFMHLLSAQDRQLVGLRADLGPKGFGPGADVDRLLGGLDRVLQTASEMMAGTGQTPLVCVDVGPLPPAPAEPKPRSKVTAEQAGLLILPPMMTAAPAPESTSLDHLPPAVDPVFAAQADAALADLGARADRYNVTVAFRSDLSSFAAIERAIRRSSCPWFGVDLDPVGVLRDRWEGDEIFSRLGGLVRHVRGRDASVSVADQDRRTRPAVVGQGDTDWGQFLANLDQAGYASWLTLDPIDLPDRPAAAAAGIARLKKF